MKWSGNFSHLRSNCLEFFLSDLSIIEVCSQCFVCQPVVPTLITSCRAKSVHVFTWKYILLKCPCRYLQSGPHAREPHSEQCEVGVQNSYRRHPLPQDGREAPARFGRGGGTEALHWGPSADPEGAGGQARRLRAPLFCPRTKYLWARRHQKGVWEWMQETCSQDKKKK